VCVWRGGALDGFMTKEQPFPMDGHYRIDIISGMGHPRSDSIVQLMLCTVVVQVMIND
jgi:hypothetical protein